MPLEFLAAVVLAIDISPLLGWAVDIIEFAVDWVWIICSLTFSVIMIDTFYRVWKGAFGSSSGHVRRPG